MPSWARRMLHNPARAGGSVAIAVALGLTLAACSSGGSAKPGSTVGSGPYPVTVSSCGNKVTYTAAPKRAVSNDINSTEDMLALGLQSHMVGTFGVAGDAPEGATAVPSKYLKAFQKVRDVSSNYFTLEQLVGLHPDFLFAGWNYGLQVGTNLTPQYFSRFGIKTLVLGESCAHVEPTQTVSIDETYDDLSNLGEIFGVEKTATTVIDNMKTRIAHAQKKVAGLAPVTVFDYDSGQAAPFTGPGLAMINAEISLAGGTNIFGSLKQSWTTVSWEQVVAADPQCIIINNYGTPTAAQKEQFLETSSITKNLTAVKNRCFLALPYDEITPSPQDALAVGAIARWLHPSAFGNGSKKSKG